MSHEIIIGFDGSEQAHDAIALGRRLATATGRPLVVAKVYFHDHLDDLYTYGDFEREATAEARDVLDALIGLPVADTLMVGSSSPARGLHDLAEERSAAAIVVGSTHHGRLGRVAPGSVARQLLSGAPCAVAVAPVGFANRDGDGPFETIAVAFDGSWESRHALHTATQLAQRVGARVDLIGVARPPHLPLGTSAAITTGNRTFSDQLVDQLQGKLDEAMQSVPKPHRGIVEAHVGEPVATLLLRSQTSGLLVCGSRGYGRGRQVLLGSTSAWLVDEAWCPVLVVPRGGEVVTNFRAGAATAELAARG